VLRDQQATLTYKLDAAARANQEATAEVKDAVAALEAATAANQVATGDVKNAVAALDAALRKAALLPPEIDERQALDAYYRRFEDRFRGSADEIRARLEYYIPILVAQAAPARYLDVGCGRGELLELARHHGLHMAGVDASEAMVAQCREHGLEAVLGDGAEHLAAIDRGSLAGVTAIHVIEHLPFRTLARLVAAAFRALRPGGVLVFETPNPENLIVGACNFYYDPTHVRPLPPEPVRYLLESAGFEHVAIERLHAGATPDDVARATDDVSRLYTSIMLVPQDYAVIGYKPMEARP
jgi:O-antigen chain-terminating methyltransferase